MASNLTGAGDLTGGSGSSKLELAAFFGRTGGSMVGGAGGGDSGTGMVGMQVSGSGSKILMGSGLSRVIRSL